jgi:hypothetical protein
VLVLQAFDPLDGIKKLLYGHGSRAVTENVSSSREYFPRNVGKPNLIVAMGLVRGQRRFLGNVQGYNFVVLVSHMAPTLQRL